MSRRIYLIIIILLLISVGSANADMLSVSSGCLRLFVSDYDGSFILYGRRYSDVSADMIPLLWEDSVPTSGIRIWIDDSPLLWHSPKNGASHSANVTDRQITLTRFDNDTSIELSYTLCASDDVSDDDSLLIRVSVRPLPYAESGHKMLPHRLGSDIHTVHIRICYDTYLGEQSRRHFTYISKNADASDDISHTLQVLRRIFGRQQPKRDFDELPGTKIINRESVFTKYVCPTVTSSTRPDSIALHLCTFGDGLTTPSRIYFANWNRGNSESLYHPKNGTGFYGGPYDCEDSAAFFEYDIVNAAADVTVDITAAASITSNPRFTRMNDETSDEIHSENVIDVMDVTSDMDIDRLLNGINVQLDGSHVEQVGVNQTQRLLNEIKEK